MKFPSTVLSWLRTNAEDVAIVLALGALTFLVVGLDLEGIGTGGDAIRKWHFVRQWHYANSFRHAEWDHHMARFGVHWVTYLVQVVFGRGPAVYYVPGLLAVSVQAMLVYGCGKRLLGRFAGVLAAFILIYFKATVRAGSQLMPEAFSGTYAIVATYLFLRYADSAGRRKMGWLVAMSAALALDYYAKETSVFFFPGFVLAIWIAGGRYRDVGVLCAILALAFVAETACYKLFTDYASRMAVIVVNHMPEDPKGPRDFLELFNRFPKMDEPWKLGFYSFLPIGLGVVAFARNFRATAVYLIVAGYLFFLTFMVRQLHPFAVWQSFRARYFDPTAPFVALMAGLFFTLVLRELLAPYAKARIARRFIESSRWSAAAALTAVLVAGSVSYAVAAPDLDNHVLRVNARMSEVATDAYVRNLPIVSTHDNRATWTVFAVLIDDKLLARRNILPNWEDARIEDGSRWWLVKDKSKYDLAKLNRMLRAKCAVEVTVIKPNPISAMRPMKRLPASCDRLEEEP